MAKKGSKKTIRATPMQKLVEELMLGVDYLVKEALAVELQVSEIQRYLKEGK